MLDGGIITGLLTLFGAGSFIGEEVAKEAVKHYAPKAFSRLDETVESIWSSLRRGEIKEAERQVEESGLSETIVTSAAELQRQTVVLSTPDMENEFASRVRALENATDYAFELSRQWRMDLLLPGGLSDECELTLFKTAAFPAAKFTHPDWDLGFAPTRQDRAMWVLTKEKAGELSVKQMLADYRATVVGLRQRSNQQYVSIFSKLGRSIAPVVFVDGGAMTALAFSGQQWSLINNQFHTFRLENTGTVRVPVETWMAGVTRMEDALRDMPSWLRLSTAEQAAVKDRLQ